MPNPQTLDSIANDGTGLRLHLQWDQDRYHQHVEWVSGSLVTPLLQSAEACEKDPQLGRPVLQQLTVESRGIDSQVALGVGMSGQSHWSFSIETVPESRTLVFDIACRLTEPIENLGSCYRLLASVSHVEPTHCELNVVGHPCRIEIDSSAKSENLRLHLDDDQLHLLLQPVDGDQPITVRWRYRVVG